MANRILLSAGLTFLLGGSQLAVSANTSDDISSKYHEQEMQYQQNQESLKPVNDRIQMLNQQIQATYAPFNAKYKSLDDSLQQISKPYQTQINQLNAQIRAAEAPYDAQIQQRNEEQRKLDWETRPLRDEIRQLNASTWQLRKAVEAQGHDLQRTRQEMQRYYQSQNQLRQQQIEQHIQYVNNPYQPRPDRQLQHVQNQDLRANQLHQNIQFQQRQYQKAQQNIQAEQHKTLQTPTTPQSTKSNLPIKPVAKLPKPITAQQVHHLMIKNQSKPIQNKTP